MRMNPRLPNQFPSSGRIPYESNARLRLMQSLAATPCDDMLPRTEMPPAPAGFRSIVVPLDGTAYGERALPLAISVAKQAGASVRLLHVYQPIQGDFYPTTYTGMDKKLHRQQLDYVRRVARQVREAAKVTVIPQCIRRQNVVQGICEVANPSNDLVVAVTRKYGWLERVWSGSTVHELVDQVAAPMLVLRGDGLRPAVVPKRWLRQLLIPLDGSMQAERVLNSAISLGSLYGADYSLLTVVPHSVIGLTTWNDEEISEREGASRKNLERITRHLRPRFPKLIGQTEVTSDSVAEAIIRRAEALGVDCIAIAKGRRHGLRRWLQPSVTHRVIELAHVPVLVLPREAARKPAL